MMDLEDLKSNWKLVESGKKSQDQLLEMIKIKNHPNIKRMRLKFLFEGFVLIIFTIVYYDAFDGATKPLWANILLFSTSVAFVIIRFVGWLTLRNPIKEKNLKKSLIKFKHNLKSIAFSIVGTTLMFGIAVISFFSSSVEYTKSKYLVLAFIILSLIVLVYLSSQNWIKKVRIVNTALSEFEEKTKR